MVALTTRHGAPAGRRIRAARSHGSGRRGDDARQAHAPAPQRRGGGHPAPGHARHRRRQRGRQDHAHPGHRRGARPGPGHRPLRGRLPPVRPRGARHVPFTVLNPDCNYIDVMEQHLQLLALGPADPQAGLRPFHRRAGPPGAGGAPRLRDRGGPAAAAHQAGPRLLRHHRLPRPAGGDPAGVEAAPRQPPSAATPASRCSPNWSGASRSRPPSSGRSASGPTSRQVRAGGRARHPPQGTPLSAEILLRPTIQHPELATCSPTTTGGPCT